MAQSKRSSNTQQTKKAAPRNQGSAKASANRQPKASPAAATAQARSGGRAPSRSATTVQGQNGWDQQPYTGRAYAGPMHAPVLDDGVRHDIAGVIIGVIGVALLIAVLTPTSGVLTQAVSDGLHAVLGLGAFLLPAALLLWALTFFVHIPSIEPGRVAIGLGLVSLAVMGLVGLCTPNADTDPSLLFNAFVLADRGGYVGNGLAWLLLTLVGKIVGLVVLAGVVIAGLIVIGFNATGALQSFMARQQQHRAIARARSEERAAAAARQQHMAWVQRNGASMPADYAPTALFDPERPLTRDGREMGAPECDPYGRPVSYGAPMEPNAYGYGAPTSVLPYAPQPVGAPQTTSVIRTRADEQAPAPVAPAHYFGCGNMPLGMEEEPVAEPQPIEEPAAPAPVTTRVERRVSQPTTFITPEMIDAREEEAAYDGGTHFAPMGQPTPEPEPARTPSRRLRQASQWWDPADDWNREDFDPRERSRHAQSAFVPGVLPGAPVEAWDDEPIEEEALTPIASTVGADPAQTLVAAATTPVPETGDEVVDRVSALTSAALAANAADPTVAPKRRPGDAGGSPSKQAVAPVKTKVALPWEDPQADVAGEAVSLGSHTFVLPNPAIFRRNASGLENTPEQHREAAETASLLQAALNEFGVKAEVVDWVVGPSCTTYQVKPGEGVRVNRFTALEEDIARVLARPSVRVYAPVPGTSYVGIEVSSNSRSPIMFGDVLSCLDGGPLDFVLGLDTSGKPIHADLAKLPHLLVAGTTGSGKSVCMNTIIMSMLVRNTPDDVRIIMVDPKQVEFANYNGVPHLVMPVVTDMRQAAAALQWGVTEMDRRYRIFSNLGVRDLKSYNAQVDSGAFENTEFPLQHLPSVVFFIDELADLMMVAKKDVEASIVRIAQLGRACGIHLVIATQTPRADIVTGLIRANVANRIALRVSKAMDSKIIIDQTGAEKLLPHGDMLFLEAGFGDKPRRIQGCYLSDDEISRVVEHLKQQDASAYNSAMAPLPGTQLVADLSDDTIGAPPHAGAASGGGGSDDDPLAWEAAQLVVENQLGSTSMIQRRLKLGYARAGRVMDMLEEMGVVGPARGSKPRDVLIRDLDELASLRGGCDGSEEDY